MDSLVLLNYAVAGGIVIAAAAIALFFTKFWRVSHERLFLILAFAFLLLAVERVALLFQPLPFVPLQEESRHWLYVLRLVAFLSITAAVIDKNRRRRRRTEAER